MPYPHSLDRYTKPEFFMEPPDSWTVRLREISPVLPGMDHLRFRCFLPREDWYYPERPIWALYTAKPLALVEPDRAAQFRQHWSELPEDQQVGRRAVVSDYQHFMWHTQGLYVRPFWYLQGQWGGTPAKYSERERRYLDASNAISEPYPIGFFPAVPFDERAVRLILERDRLLKACNRFDELEKMDRPAAMKLEDEEAERVFRQTYLDTWREMIRPSAEFMQSYLRKTESYRTLPDAPEGLADKVAKWREHFLETGAILDAGVAHQRRVPAAVV